MSAIADSACSQRQLSATNRFSCKRAHFRQSRNNFASENFRFCPAVEYKTDKLPQEMTGFKKLEIAINRTFFETRTACSLNTQPHTCNDPQLRKYAHNTPTVSA